MKTILIYDQHGLEEIQFAVLDGDYSHLNGVYLNAYTESKKGKKLQDELNKLLFDEDGNLKMKFVHDFPIKVQAVAVIVVGFVP